MKISRLRIRNFRCFQEEIYIDFDEITVLIGKNDSGKSTILDALDIFLNDVDPDKDDASKTGDPKDLVIICEFIDLPSELILDDEYQTKLSDEYLLNSEGRLEIHKCFSGELQKPKCKSIEAFAIHPSVDKVKDLLQLKNVDLKRRAKEIGVDLSSVDQRINAQIRSAIRSHFSDLGLFPAKIPLNDDNGKMIWTALRKYLPAFALFKSDRASTDQDPEAQDPLKAAVKEAIKAKETELSQITEYVRVEVQKIASLTLQKLREMDPTLATQLNPTFTPPKWDSLFKASITSDEDIPINKRGSGVKRLILLNFFRAKAEQIAQDTGRLTLIYAIEEPETSQHPNNQKMLLKTLIDLSSEAQVIISTHTPMLARTLPDHCLRYIRVNKGNTREILKGGPETNNIFTQSLGVLPDTKVKLFIGVEGINDQKFLVNMAKVMRNSGIDVLDLETMDQDGDIIFFLLGGSSLALWSSRLANLNKPEFHLYDRDTVPPQLPKYHEFIELVNARSGCKAMCTTKREIENYIHKNAIIAAYRDDGINLDIDFDFNPYDDVPILVAKLVHSVTGDALLWDDLEDEKRGKKESRAKSMICSKATNYMTTTLIDEVDPDHELLGWYRSMEELIQGRMD